MSAYERIVSALTEAGVLRDAPSVGSLAGITDDSRHVQPGWLFCAVEGTADDGHAYLPDAASRGAAAAIVTRPADLPLPQIVVRDGRVAAALAAAEWFGRPAEAMRTVGVTGTNGKSTTVALLRHLLNADAKVAALGTLGAFDGEGNAIYEEGLTTPGPVQLHQTLGALRDRGCDTVVMEVSSHALEQGRTAGVAFDAAVYTNLTRDHLDYHASVDAYRAAKWRLAASVPSGGVVVIDADDPAWADMPVGPGVTVRRYGRSDRADVRATDIRLRSDGTVFAASCDGDVVEIETPLIGGFNVSNTLAALTTGAALGVPRSVLASRLAGAPQVPGRMERLHTEPFLVLRDYAHTPDALERALRAARGFTTGRLIALFGCGGDRDRGKRAEMGRIGVEGADVAVITSDNPRTEDPERILDDIESGIDGRAFVRVADRREAIRRAVGMLHDGDCLLLAGKGHETYQVLGTEKVPFDEPEIVADALAQRAER